MANRGFDISVVLCTHNRCGVLPAALESLLSQETGDVRYEIIVVDNNSTDYTREVVASFLLQSRDIDVRYLFEPTQGISHARNSGIRNARAPLVAFTDDDVRVAPDWLVSIIRTFNEHPEVDCVGGRVLPIWESEPPSWLTPAHWSPIAVLDYDRGPMYLNCENPLCVIGANFAFRREVFDAVGYFSPDFQRVKDSIGSMEDHELQVRIWHAGRQAFYTPDVTVGAWVSAGRMTKAYHRRWHRGHGYFHALLGLPDIEESNYGRLFDVPAHMYRQAAVDAIGWLTASILRQPDRAFAHEIRLQFFRGFFGKRHRDFVLSRKRGTPRELATFIRSVAARTLRRAA
jgi:glucosyl-dolichyl phosphate glucuronosyltransferase